MVFQYKLNLHKTQMETYDDPHKHKVVAAGKGWGKTDLVAKSCAGLAMTKPGSQGAVIAPFAKQAHYDYKLIRSLIPSNLIADQSVKWMNFELKNKAEVAMFSAENIEALRGFAWDWAIVDEAAFMDAEVLYVIDSQVGKRDGDGWYISTPNGRGIFYDLYCREQQDETWKSFHYTTYDNPFYPRAVIDRMKATMPEIVFRQEILAEFIEGGIVFPHLAEIMTSEYRDPIPGHDYITGADIASTNDFTVIKTFDTADNHEVQSERFTSRDWTYIRQAIYAICKQYNNSTLIIDKTGVGAPVVEDLMKMDAPYTGAPKQGYLTVVPVIFSSVSKPQLYSNYIMAHENRTIRLLPDPITKKEHEDFMMTRGQGTTGYMKYSAPKGRNDDTVTACALAVWGLDQMASSQLIGTPEIVSKAEHDENNPYNMEEVAEWEPEDDGGQKGVGRAHDKIVLKRFFDPSTSYKDPTRDTVERS